MIKTIQLQKRLMFIPYVNIFNLFIWLYTCIQYFKVWEVLSKTAFILVSTFLPAFVFQFIVSDYFPLLANALSYIVAYVGPTVMSYRLILLQEKLLTKD